MDNGTRRWIHQVGPDDVWVIGCDPKPNPGCPKGALGPDFDLGGSPLLTTTPNGNQVLIVSSKSGIAWGFDVDHDGKILWQTQVAQGGTRGGIEWGGASDGTRIYFPISDSRDDVPFSTRQNATHPTPGGVSALDLASGKLLWHTPAPEPVCAWGTPCYAAQPGAPTVIPGVVFAGSWDGHERAYSVTDGRILWDFDTGRTFEGVNGAKVTGGSIDGGSQTVAAGALFVNSGVRDHAGNALLVFTVNGK
jgi:polyvinyl alcohol dehydrogenase (cytochrome)